MPILFRDIETRSVLNLAKVGSWRYAADPSTEVLCVGFAIDAAPAKIWTPDQPIPPEFFEAARDPRWLVAAHNDAFERAIEELVLTPRFNWPLVPIERHRCTMAAALASAFPAALESAATALDLPHQKDAEGYRVMRQMSRPRAARKGEDPSLVYWHDDPDRRERLHRYCAKDVDVERALWHRLPPLLPPEQEIWQLDAIINQRGFYADLPDKALPWLSSVSVLPLSKARSPRSARTKIQEYWRPWLIARRG
jgi:DNA polymerase